ncbi:hypothetical protein QDF24_000803 [Escherichia coli]|uniref:hypothetical protein n=1 Tax=Escherichia coli TaxID=562 RepID=UPI001850D700|nr:hypothetical protein [Escherichia coli]EFF9539377.1 hypothetical protein [Escherichia coli]EFM6597289.1 hypothetical protein [Escherichia coli]EKT0191504.1 hypothetical protein [Escherichia coli]MDD8641920.1 hypothetical protein [Escherichia coli]
MITSKDIQEIQLMITDSLKVTKKKEGSCLYISALLFAQINDNLRVTPRFVTGSLALNNRLIFSHDPILPALRSGHDFSALWNGHAWVEIKNLIFDPSVFLTIYSPSTPQDIQNKFEKTFKGKFSYLIGERDKLEKLGVVYKTYEHLSNDDANILINCGFRAGFFDKNIC